VREVIVDASVAKGDALLKRPSIDTPTREHPATVV
jgi:hypothetical protein